MMIWLCVRVGRYLYYGVSYFDSWQNICTEVVLIKPRHISVTRDSDTGLALEKVNTKL